MLDWKSLPVGDHRTACPVCSKGTRDSAASVTIDTDGRVVLHCFRCGTVLTHRGEARSAMHRPVSRKPRRESLGAWGMALWDECEPIAGVAMSYLRSRRCRIPPEDGDLRWHPRVKHPSGHIGPALVGLITHVETRAPLSLHRTWITSTGKAHVSPTRMPLAGHSTAGGCIRLWPDEAVTYGLAIAEGVETALSIAWAYAPAWSTIDAGHLAKFPVLPGVQTLVIGQDRDPAGENAAQACAQRWADADREVLVTRQAANDLNDVLQEAV